MFEQHTPGPWVDAPTGNMAKDYAQPFAVASHGGTNLVCGCFGDGKGGVDSARANARLIAAAPELLEALEGLIANLAEGDFTSLTRFDAGRAAIAKARGQ